MLNRKSLFLKGSAFVTVVTAAVAGTTWLLRSNGSFEAFAKSNGLVTGQSTGVYKGTPCHSFENINASTDGRHRLFFSSRYYATDTVLTNNGNDIGGFATDFNTDYVSTSHASYGFAAKFMKGAVMIGFDPSLSPGQNGSSPSTSNCCFLYSWPGFPGEGKNAKYNIYDGNHELSGYQGMLPNGILTYEPSATLARNPVLEIHLQSDTSNSATFNTEVGSLINYIKYASSTIEALGWGSYAPLVRLIGDGATPFQLTCSGAASRYAVIHCGGLSLENIDLTIDYDFNDEYKNGNTGNYTGPIILEETPVASDGYIHSGELKIASNASLTLNVGKTNHTVGSTTMSAPGFGIWAGKITLLDGAELNINLKQPTSAPSWNGYAPIVLNKGESLSSTYFHYGKSASVASAFLDSINTVEVSRDCFKTADGTAPQEKVAFCIDNSGGTNVENFVYEVHSTESANMLSTMENGYMHMNDYDALKTGKGLGYCSDSTHHYYETAKAAISMDYFGDTNRLAFKNSSSGAYARLQSWALLNGETATIDSAGAITFSSLASGSLQAVSSLGGDGYATILISCAAAVALSSFAVIVVITKKRNKKTNK